MIRCSRRKNLTRAVTCRDRSVSAGFRDLDIRSAAVALVLADPAMFVNTALKSERLNTIIGEWKTLNMH